MWYDAIGYLNITKSPGLCGIVHAGHTQTHRKTGQWSLGAQENRMIHDVKSILSRPVHGHEGIHALLSGRYAALVT